jgi:putative ribosome biogenesis GTPase RsgA
MLIQKAPQGTVVHPSVYLIFDEYCHVFLNSKELTYRSHIEKWRSHIAGTKSGLEFWNDHDVLTIEDPTAVRILVCGNNGVGKSTLINGVFGFEIVGCSSV